MRNMPMHAGAVSVRGPFLLGHMNIIVIRMPAHASGVTVVRVHCLGHMILIGYMPAHAVGMAYLLQYPLSVIMVHVQ
jgi:hypothetical protein